MDNELALESHSNREPSLTATPPRSPDALRALTTDDARALLALARRPNDGPAESGAFAILGAQGEILFATPIARRLFGVGDRVEIQRAFGSSDGPSARRLRHLAAHLPVGAPPRLERVHFSLGRRAASANILCARVSTPSAGTVLVLWTPGTEGGEGLAEPSARSASSGAPAFNISADSPSKSRFLWSCDSKGRFGATDPLLSAALGADAPRQGETLDHLRSRVEIHNADELAKRVERRETFTDLALVWRRREAGLDLRLALSAAPSFDSQRQFAGYRGFGTLAQLGDGAAPSEASEGSDNALSKTETRFVGTETATPGTVDSLDALQASPTMTGEPTALLSKQAEAPLPSSCAAGDERDREAGDNLREGADPDALQVVPQPPRTAEIYFLRQAVVAPSKIIPIRPSAVETLAPYGAPGAGGSVELSHSEREAFREIAQALVGSLSSKHEEESAEAPLDYTPDSSLDARIAALPPAGGAGPEEVVQDDASRLLDRLPVGVLVARDARTLYVNRTLLDLLGYRDLEQFMASEALAIMFRGHDPQTIAVEDSTRLLIVKADGSPLTVDGAARAALWDGAPATLFSLWPSEQRKAPRASERAPDDRSVLAESAGDLREMLDLATDGAVILDAAGRIVSFNRPAELLFGYKQREVMGESVLMLLAPQCHAEATAGLDRLSREDGAPEPERLPAIVGRNRDGGALRLDLTLARIGAADDFSYCALVRDVGQEREAAARLVAARDAALGTSAAKTEFLAQVSHEIRTPLSAILGFAEVMMEERFGPIGSERYRDYLRDIHTSGKLVVSLADDLLDLSKIESGKFELEFTSVDANCVIRQCVSLIQPQAVRERVILRVSLFERLPHVTVDERSLKQIMLNLMSNAVKYTEPGGQVIVSTAVDAAGQVVIRVRDTGVGMSETEVSVALEPFGQIGPGGRKGGVGLGLPLTKALVEANKAEFSIKSRRNQGTLIEIAFPIVQAAQ